MTLADFPQVQALSVSEKLELVDELWKDMAEDLEHLETSREVTDLLDQRWREHLAAPHLAMTVDEFFEKWEKRGA